MVIFIEIVRCLVVGGVLRKKLGGQNKYGELEVDYHTSVR